MDKNIHKLIRLIDGKYYRFAIDMTYCDVIGISNEFFKLGGPIAEEDLTDEDKKIIALDNTINGII